MVRRRRMVSLTFPPSSYAGHDVLDVPLRFLFPRNDGAVVQCQAFVQSNLHLPSCRLGDGCVALTASGQGATNPEAFISSTESLRNACALRLSFGRAIAC